MLKDKTPMPPAEPADPPVGRASNLLTSFGYAFQGIAYTLRTQRNMKIHLGLGLAAMLLALWLQITALVAIALVYTLEMINTVVEAIVDLASPQYHPLAKVAKDVAAGAVLVAAFFAVAVGAFLFLPRLVGIFL
jgi:diacylglycerol kinase